MQRRTGYFKERYRPQFHYSAQSHVINDPNGLFYYEGEYHLMHQYNIHNQIHWGHAISDDLVHWRHLPPALAPDSIGQIWSGSAVVDWQNTSGLQCGKEKVIIALFTYNEHVDSQQSQGLAYSNDRGRTWQKYHRNPVLTGAGKKDFRDPKVFWFEQDKRWIMVLACGDHVEFYRSENLIDWEFAGAFGAAAGSHEGIWECPDLFQLPIIDEPYKTRWVLFVSVNSGAPAGGTGMQYFVGEFDGKRFLCDDPQEKSRWLDYGKDFYAGVTWNDIPACDGRRLIIGWADNWLYRDQLPVSPFKGQFSSVRELGLITDRDEMHLIQKPVGEMKGLRTVQKKIEAGMLMPGNELILPIEEKQAEIRCEVLLEDQQSIVKIRIAGDNGDYMELIYNCQKQIISLDRTHCSGFKDGKFEGVFHAPLELKNHILKLHLLVDESQLEVFAGQGEVVMTNLFFIDSARFRVSMQAEKTPVKVLDGRCYVLTSVWPPKVYEFDRFDHVIAGDWAETVAGLEGCSDGEALLTGAEHIGNFHMEISIKIMPYYHGQAAGIAFGVENMEKGWRLLLDAGKNMVELWFNKTVIAQYDVALNQKRAYRICVKMEGQEFEAYLDGVSLFREKLITYTGGKLGLCVRGTDAVYSQICLV